MNKFPIIYFEENLIFNKNKDCWALYRFNNFDYEYITAEKKMTILGKLVNFINNIGHESKIYIIPKIDQKNHFEKLKKYLNKDELYNYSKSYLINIENYIKKFDEAKEYYVYISVNLVNKGDVIENVKDAVSYLVKEPMKFMESFFMNEEYIIPERKLKEYKKLANDFIKQQNGRMSIEKATVEEIQFLLKRVFCRGVKDIKIWEKWTPKVISKDDNGIEPYSKDILNVVSGIKQFGIGNIKIEHDDETTSYQTFIPLTRIPKSWFPGSEFLMHLQGIGFPVETIIHIKQKETKSAMKDLEKKKQEVKNQMQHIDENQEHIPDELNEAQFEVDELENELRTTKSPLLYTKISFCVYADTEEGLKDRRQILMNYLKDNDYGVQYTRFDQENLFMESIVGTGYYLDEFIMPITSRVLASSMFGTTCNLGDDKGFYIGTGGLLNKPIFLDLLHACQQNKPSSAYIVGAQGFGKTFNSNLLVYLHVLNGSRAFIIDPKGDRKNWEKKLPELAKHITTINVGTDEKDKGTLDPFQIYRYDIGAGCELARNILTELFDVKTGSIQDVVLREAIDEMRLSANPCMNELYKCLYNFKNDEESMKTARLLSRLLKTLDRPGLAGLVYGDGSQKGLNFDNRINILMIQNLKLPSSSTLSKEDYTAEERVSTVIMLLLANFAKKFSQMDSSLKKIVVMDEAWALAKTQQGQTLFERLARTGRSLNTSCIFIGHSSRDLLDEGIRNAIRYKFIFNVGNREEAEITLKFLGMDITDENIELLVSDSIGLKNGECLFSDVEGRIGLLKFDAVYKHLIEAFKTTPPDRRVNFEKAQ